MSADLGFLLGTWRGSGRGGFPPIDDFEYEEEMSFTDAGDGLIVYDETAWLPGKGEQLHSEFGYLRVLEDGKLDFTLAYPFGVSETMTGSLADGEMRLETVSIAVAPAGEPVLRLQRRISVEEDAMEYETLMETPSQGLTRHLTGTLTRS